MTRSSTDPTDSRPADTPGRSSAAGTGRPARAAGASVFVADAATAVWAALVSFLPLLILVVAGWLVDGQQAASATTAVRFAGVGWLLGHGVPVGTGIGPVGLTPLLLTALIVWRLVRAGRHTARAVGADRPSALTGALGVAVGYGVLAALVALLVSTDGSQVSPLRALWTAGLLALVSAGAGAVYESGMGAHVAGQLAPAVRDGLRGGTCAALGLLGLGALAAGAGLAVHASDAADMLRSYHAGPVGDIGLCLLCLLYAPNLAVWAVGYLAGPGFAVGTGTSVGVAGVQLGAVPAVPVLAGLPTEALPAAGTLLLALPLAVGVVAGVVLARRSPGRPAQTVLAGMVAGGCAGVLSGVAGVLAAGPIGSGSLAQVGASWWQLGLACAGLIGVGSIVAGLAARLVGRRAR